MACLKNQFLPVSVLVVSRVLGSPPSLSDCLIYWHKTVDKISNNPSNFIGVGCDLSIFIHNFVNLGPFSILLNKSGQWPLIDLINYFKEPASSFVDLLYCAPGY